MEVSAECVSCRDEINDEQMLGAYSKAEGIPNPFCCQKCVDKIIFGVGLLDSGPKALGKECACCNEYKLLSEYYIKVRRLGTRDSYCKECRKLDNKLKYDEKKEYFREQNKKNYQRRKQREAAKSVGGEKAYTQTAYRRPDENKTCTHSGCQNNGVEFSDRDGWRCIYHMDI